MQDLPCGVLSRLLADADKESWSALFGTCKRLRDITLAEADVVRCLFDISIVSPTQAAKSLQHLATCKEGAEVKLVLQDGSAWYGDLEHLPATQMSSWLTTLCIEHGSVMAAVTHIEIKGHVAGGLIPAGIETCCPKLTHFTRLGWFPYQPGADIVSMGPCRQLQHLTIRDLAPCHSELGEKSNMPAEWLRQQFRRLPNLQSLYCEFSTDYDERENWQAVVYNEAGDYLAKSIEPLHAQLKSLSLPCGHGLVPGLCVYTWPQLWRLCMPDAFLRDEHVDLLIRQAPQITELEVSEFLVDNNDEVQVQPLGDCKWRQLTACTVNCAALALLPLAGLQTLRISSLLLALDSWSHMPAAASALSCVEHVHAEWGLELWCPGIGISEDQVLPLVALLQALRQSHIILGCHNMFDAGWVQVLALSPCRTLTVDVGSVPENSWATLLQQVPQLLVLHLEVAPSPIGRPCTWLAHLDLFCKSASRPCTLKVSSDLAHALGEGWQHQLEGSMQAAGHQHVSIQTSVSTTHLIVRTLWSV